MRLILSALSLAIVAPLSAADRPNILFIAVDDLKPMMGCYGDKTILTPNLDRLAARGTVFLNAHTQQAVCGPSRASLLTGLRPDTTKVYDLKTRIRSVLPDVVTLPQHFRQAGYETIGMGKIFDPRSVDGRKEDDPASWSRPYIHTDGKGGVAGFLNPDFVARATNIMKEKGIRPGDTDALKEALGGFPPTEGEDVPDAAYEDGELADAAVAQVRELASRDEPFFLAVGFHKPHLPFVAPKKYWDLYDRDQIDLAEFTTLPTGAPGIAFQDSNELKNGSYQRDLIPKGPGLLPEPVQRQLIHGYMACVSYVDAQVGKLLDALDASPAAQDTIIVLWGDHGFHLGDHGMWCKHTNYEQATRVPLLFARPGQAGAGGRSQSPVEFLDIYPTLCDLAGLPIPAVLQGTSLVPILDDPKASVKPAARSQYPRGSEKSPVMGYAWRDERYRYVQWIDSRQPGSAPVAAELYDYETDPGETRNLVSDPAHADTLARFEKLAAATEKDPTPPAKSAPPAKKAQTAKPKAAYDPNEPRDQRYDRLFPGKAKVSYEE
ncbi:MAG: sulfatase [Verrucomicrobiales bacterium]|nr:sulfatase [Verrucomicrobiales bacterium]